jgi:hypothetical protein
VTVLLPVTQVSQHQAAGAAMIAAGDCHDTKDILTCMHAPVLALQQFHSDCHDTMAAAITCLASVTGVSTPCSIRCNSNLCIALMPAASLDRPCDILLVMIAA